MPILYNSLMVILDNLTYLTYADIVCSDILIASASSHFVYYLPPRRSILGDIKGLVQGDVRFIQIFLQAFHPCHSLSTSGLLVSVLMVSFSARLAGVSGFSLLACPNHLSRLVVIWVLHGVRPVRL